MKKELIEDVFLKYCDLTYDVGDEKVEEIDVISFECFEDAVNELYNLSERQTTTGVSETQTQCAIQNVCGTCKHWGGQGTTGLIKTTEGDCRTCMAYLFDDIDNEDFRPMPDWEVTFGSLNGAKGVLQVHKDFGCINHNLEFDK